MSTSQKTWENRRKRWDAFRRNNSILQVAKTLACERYNGKEFSTLPERIQRDLMMDAEGLWKIGARI